MRLTSSISLAILLLISTSNLCCQSIPCGQIKSSNYSSYEKLSNAIKHGHFAFSETVNTERSSWVRGASYYSCDRVTGFMILELNDHEYVHIGVPVEIWKGFKRADSFGSYYNRNIKGRYRGL